MENLNIDSTISNIWDNLNRNVSLDRKLLSNSMIEALQRVVNNPTNFEDSRIETLFEDLAEDSIPDSFSELCNWLKDNRAYVDEALQNYMEKSFESNAYSNNISTEELLPYAYSLYAEEKLQDNYREILLLIALNHLSKQEQDLSNEQVNTLKESIESGSFCGVDFLVMLGWDNS